MRTQASSRYPSLRQVFRPGALGFIGLAIAVALWGFGYKLSLYYPRADSTSRVPVAKLWIKQRNAPVAAASSLKAKSHRIPGSQVFPLRIQGLRRLARAVACIVPVCRRGVTYFDFLIPFRSPPTQRFSLA
jgi:hypothetical protein